MAVGSNEAAKEVMKMFPGLEWRKGSRHVAVMLSHLNKQREKALAQREKLTREIEALDAAILALG
jgi:hypothetical protein